MCMDKQDRMAEEGGVVDDINIPCLKDPGSMAEQMMRPIHAPVYTSAVDSLRGSWN